MLESFVTKTPDNNAALNFQKKEMRMHGRPEVIVTDRLGSYGAALRDIGAADRQETDRWLNSRAEKSHLPFRRRERAMLRFRRMRSLQKFASVHASVLNHFNQEHHLCSRQNFKQKPRRALAEWRLRCSRSDCLFVGELTRVRIRLTIPHRSIEVAEAGMDQFAIRRSLGEEAPRWL